MSTLLKIFWNFLNFKIFGFRIFRYFLVLFTLAVIFYVNQMALQVTTRYLEWDFLGLKKNEIALLLMLFYLLRPARLLRFFWIPGGFILGTGFFLAWMEMQKYPRLGIAIADAILLLVPFGFLFFSFSNEPEVDVRDAEAFYRSRAWKKLRYEVLRVHGKKCMCCGRDDRPVHVDHIKPRSKYPELALDIDNLQVLCDQCNLGKSNEYEDDFR